jgi:flagellar biosynthetic protein FliP
MIPHSGNRDTQLCSLREIPISAWGKRRSGGFGRCDRPQQSRNGMRTLALFALGTIALCGAAQAQTINLRDLLPEGQGTASARIIQLVALLTVLSIAPAILVTATCFTRFIIALSFLRSGLGLPSTPSNVLLISLALFMTFFVMGPTFDRMWNDGVQPLLENRIDEREAYDRITRPAREFMKANVRAKDVALFEDLLQRRGAAPKSPAADDLRVLVPAFMISELRRGFEIGFLILLPFLVIDLVVATLVMSMGMMMLPPTAISLPFKVLFFILIDGWNVLVGGLVRSFA